MNIKTLFIALSVSVLLAMAFSVCLVAANDPVPPERYGAIEGTVTDAVTGLPIASTTVTIVNPPVAIKPETTTTDSAGQFSHGLIIGEDVTIVFSKPGYADKTINDATINPYPEITTLNVELVPLVSQFQFVVPEFPLGTILGFAAMIVGCLAYFGVRKYRAKKQ
jgi:hypothetical protein